MEIRLLCDHSEALVTERTRLINRLRINLVVLDPELEASIPSRKLDYPGQLQRVTRRLRAMRQTARVRIAREQTRRIGTITREAEQLKRELRDLVSAQRPGFDQRADPKGGSVTAGEARARYRAVGVRPMRCSTSEGDGVETIISRP